MKDDILVLSGLDNTYGGNGHPQSLCALMATVYIATVGPKGLREIGEQNILKTDYAISQIRERTGREPLGVVKTLLYRPELFGTPFSEELDVVMRGPSDWSAGERELFAGFTSLLNQCPF